MDSGLHSSLPVRSLALLLLVAACRFDPNGVDRSAPHPDGGVTILPDATTPGPIDAATVHQPDAPMSMIDASPTDPCGTACAAAGGVCTAGACVITCPAGTCNGGTVNCPPGIPCVVSCGDTACAQGIDCTSASSCDIQCSGTDACIAGVTCAGTSCSITCDGDSACHDGVACNATSCTVSCIGDKACKDSACCGGGACGSSCTHSSGGCCSCSGC